jgi:hypothetical protein
MHEPSMSHPRPACEIAASLDFGMLFLGTQGRPGGFVPASAKFF